MSAATLVTDHTAGHLTMTLTGLHEQLLRKGTQRLHVSVCSKDKGDVQCNDLNQRCTVTGYAAVRHKGIACVP